MAMLYIPIQFFAFAICDHITMIIIISDTSQIKPFLKLEGLILGQDGIHILEEMVSLPLGIFPSLLFHF